MKTKNQNTDQEDDSHKLGPILYLGLCLLLTGAFLPGVAEGGETDPAIVSAQSESSSGHSGARLNEERLHTQMSVNVLRLPTNSSGK